MALAVPLTSAPLSPRPISLAVANATRGELDHGGAIPALGSRRMKKSVEQGALIQFTRIS